MLQGKFCQVWEYFCITVLTRLKATEKNANIIENFVHIYINYELKKFFL
jgi:hypothetical protein